MELTPLRPTPRALARSAVRIAATVSTVYEVKRHREQLARLPAPARRASSADLLHHLARELIATHGVRVTAHGRLPRGPAVLAANHLSYLDPLVITATAPSLPIAKIEAAAWPVLGEAMRTLGVMFVDRGEPASGAATIREALRTLAGGTSVLGFPEGTTSDGHAVLPFYRGLFVAAREAQVPVVPVALRYSDPSVCWVGDDAFVPHYLRTTSRSGIEASVVFGPPLDPAAFPDARTLAMAVRAVVGALRAQAHEVVS